jgi:hypothetical protein
MSYRLSSTEGHPDSNGWRIETNDHGGELVTEFVSARDAATKITELHSRLLRSEKRQHALQDQIVSLREILDVEI